MFDGYDWCRPWQRHVEPYAEIEALMIYAHMDRVLYASTRYRGVYLA